MKEVWKPIEGYEDYYEVSNTGRVRGKTRTVNYIDGRVKVFEAKEITPTPNTDGYMSLKLCRGNTYKTVRVHRLVAQAFIPNPNNYPEVNHIDCDRTNNNVSNLEWCTHEQNVRYAIEAGNHICTRDLTGKNNPNYGNHILSDIYRNDPELAKEKLGRPGGQNGKAVPVQVFDTAGIKMGEFGYLRGCADYIIDSVGQDYFSKITNKPRDYVADKISKSIKNNIPYLGYTFKVA